MHISFYFKIQHNHSIGPNAWQHCNGIRRCIKNINLGKLILCTWLIWHLSF